MDEQRSDADRLARARNPLEDILDQRRAEPTTLLLEVNSQPGEEDDRDRMLPRSPLDASGSRFTLDRSRRQRVVAHDVPGAGTTDHVHAAGASLMRPEGVPPKPVGLGRRSAVEVANLVLGRDRRDNCVAAHTSSSTPGDSSRRRSRGRLRAGASSSRTNSFHWPRGRWKRRRSAKTSSAA